MATDWAFHYFYLHSMFNHIDLVETTNQLPGFCVLTLLAIYEWLKIFFLYELVRHIMNIDARSGPEYPKPLYKVYFFSETSFDRALQVKYFWLVCCKNDSYYFQFWVFAGSIVFSGGVGRGGAGCWVAVSNVIGEVSRARCLRYACVNVNCY